MANLPALAASVTAKKIILKQMKRAKQILIYVGIINSEQHLLPLKK